MDEMKNKINKIINSISNFMDTMYFALALVCLELFCYYLELDLLIIIVVSLAVTFALLFKKDLNCLFFIFLCMSSMISLGNSPGNSPLKSYYYFEPGVNITCIFAAAIPVIIALVKGIKNIIKGNFKSPALLISIFALCIALFINGIFSELYEPLDALFGIFMVFFFGVFFIAIAPQMKINKESIIGISRQVTIYAIVPIIELIVYYFVTFFQGMSFDSRTLIFLGWGNRNTIGLLFLLCFCFIVALIRLETVRPFKIASYVIGALTVLGCIFSFSRQAYVCGGILTIAYLIYSLIRSNGKKRIFYIASLGTISVGIIIGIIFLSIKGYFQEIFLDNLISYGDGRINLWSKAFDTFKTNPIFGGGFYYLGGDPKIQLDNIMPLCCHNTILQMLSACGLVGLFAYAVYRFMTVKIIVKNFDCYKLHPVLGVAVILITSLLDIHLFDLFGTSFYVILLAMAVSPKSEAIEKENSANSENIKIDSNEVHLCEN